MHVYRCKGTILEQVHNYQRSYKTRVRQEYTYYFRSFLYKDKSDIIMLQEEKTDIIQLIYQKWYRTH